MWKLADSTRALSSQRRRTVKRAFLQEDASFYFNLKSFSCQVQQKVFLTLVSDVFLNLSFDLPVLSPLFAYLNKLDRSPSITLRYSFVSILKRQVVFVFICLKISTFLFADTYSLQSKEKCMALKSTTSAKSLHDKQIKQTLTWGFDSETAPWKYCICVVCSWYYIAIVFNFSCQNPFLTNVKDILIHMCILFLLFWWFLRGYFKHYICLSRSKPTYIKDYVNSM